MTTPTASTNSDATDIEDTSIDVCRVPNTEDKIVRVMAGVVTLLGLGLGLTGSDWWFVLVAFAGVNVIQSAFTGFCPPEILYRWIRSDA